MKAKRRKKSPPVKHDSRYITPAEANQMFDFFCKIYHRTGSVSRVAEHFRRARTSVIRTAKKFKWEERYAEIQRQVITKQDATIAKREIGNLEMVKKLKEGIVKELLEKLRDGIPLGAGIRDALAAISAEEDLLDKMPDTGKDIEIIPDVLKEALEVFKELGPEIIRAIGDSVVRDGLAEEIITGESDAKPNR